MDTTANKNKNKAVIELAKTVTPTAIAAMLGMTLGRIRTYTQGRYLAPVWVLLWAQRLQTAITATTPQKKDDRQGRIIAVQVVNRKMLSTVESQFLARTVIGKRLEELYLTRTTPF